MRRPVGLRVLSVLLLTWEPLAFALYASNLLHQAVDRGAGALALLGGRTIVTALGVAAGLALWNGRPGAIPLARLALGGAALVVVLTATTNVFPTTRPPGTEGPFVIASLTYYGAWLAYLQRTRTRPVPED